MRLKSRLSVVEQVYFQEPSGQPAMEESRYVAELESQELPYSRRYTLSEDWARLDTGWIAEPRQLRVENLEGRFTDTIPTVAARAASAECIVELSFDGENAHLVVYPGETNRLHPCTPVYIRSRKPAKALVTVYPG